MDLSGIGAAKDVLELGDQLLKIYKIGRDGSFYKQQEFLSRLREREAQVAAERTAADAADREWRGLDIALASISQTDRLTRTLSTSPFRLSSEDTREIAQQASSEGTYPLLLEAPIDIDERSPNFKDQKILDLGIGQRWSLHPCADDVQPLAGAIERPLKHRDLDVHMISRSLSDLPIILTYGHVDSDGLLWLSVYAWNIVANNSAQEPMRLAFPRIKYPNENEAASGLQQWKDEVTTQLITIIALLAQWFFLIRYGRKPTLNKLNGEGHDNQLRALLARQLVSAYEVLAHEGRSSAEFRLDQAELFADAGMHAQASVYALSILDHIRNQPQNETDYLILERLAVLLGAISDDASALEARDLLETRSKVTVYRILGWTS